MGKRNPEKRQDASASYLHASIAGSAVTGGASDCDHLISTERSSLPAVGCGVYDDYEGINIPSNLAVIVQPSDGNFGSTF